MLMHVEIIRTGGPIRSDRHPPRGNPSPSLRRHTDGRWEYGPFDYHGCGLRYRPWKEARLRSANIRPMTSHTIRPVRVAETRSGPFSNALGREKSSSMTSDCFGISGGRQAGRALGFQISKRRKEKKRKGGGMERFWTTLFARPTPYNSLVQCSSSGSLESLGAGSYMKSTRRSGGGRLTAMLAVQKAH